MLHSKTDILIEICIKDVDKYHIKARSYFQSPEIDGNIILMQDKPLQVGKFHTATLKSLRGYDISAKL
jgi:ribosomal protein S12 methylthiotransferase